MTNPRNSVKEIIAGEPRNLVLNFYHLFCYFFGFHLVLYSLHSLQKS